jgi:hypothetical protein
MLVTVTAVSSETWVHFNHNARRHVPAVIYDFVCVDSGDVCNGGGLGLAAGCHYINFFSPLSL